VEHFLKAVEEITLKDITNISQKIISSPLTMASYGDGNLLFSVELSDLVFLALVNKKSFPFVQLLMCPATDLFAASFKQSEFPLHFKHFLNKGLKKRILVNVTM
jgi:hypothetical protein